MKCPICGGTGLLNCSMCNEQGVMCDNYSAFSRGHIAHRIRERRGDFDHNRLSRYGHFTEATMISTESCVMCDGAGQYPCPTCHGLGFIEDKKE